MLILPTFYHISVSFNYLFVVYPSIFCYLLLCYKRKISLFLAVFMGFSHKKFHLSPIHFPIPHTISPLISSNLTTLFYFKAFLSTNFTYSHLTFLATLLLCYSATFPTFYFLIYLKSLIYKYPLIFIPYKASFFTTSSETKDRKNPRKVKCDQRMDQWTDGLKKRGGVV